MTTPTTTNSMRASGYVDDAQSVADRVLGTSKDLAAQAFERAGEKVRGLRSGVKDLASKSASSMSDATSAAQRQLGQYAQATGRYVSDEPIKSALIAAAIGAAVAALVLAMRRNKRYYY